MSIQKLPYEIVVYVLGHLSLYDVFNLSSTCQHFRFLALEDRICKAVLEATSPSASEVQLKSDDGKFARALRRLVKRREAISSASPFLAAIVATTETWIYEHGVLCHMRGTELRILDIHNSEDQETVVNIPKLLDAAIGVARPHTEYKFRLLYYSCNVVSCLYTHGSPDRARWLIAFDLLKYRILTAHRVESKHKIFVRNNDKYLYYGTFSELGADGFRRWALRGFDIEREKWFEDKLHLPDIMGSDLDSTVCFEILDGYFYGISNQTSFEVDEIDWTSYYCCFRFPIDQPSLQHLELAPKPQMWRRQHAEGPIDDRWTFMKLFKDESSGDLKIIESRKEWLSGHSSATRTYYTKKLLFGSGGEDENGERGSGQCLSTGSLYPVNDQLARFLDRESHPNYMAAPKRKAEEVHLGDDGSKTVLFTLSRCFIRSYHPFPQAFVDLVNDPHASEPNTQRIRVRAGSRRLRIEGERQGRLRASMQRYGDSYTLRQEIEDLYEHMEVEYWPKDCPEHDDLHWVLNPPGYAGNVHGEWDERSLIYATGGTLEGGLKALVLISFDPGIYLKGVGPFGGHSAGPSGRRTPGTAIIGRPEEQVSGMGEERKGESMTANSRLSTMPLSTHVSEGPIHTAHNGTWATKKPALYQSIGRGYHFAK